jgi:carbamoyl-phosphate synthase large subunit
MSNKVIVTAVGGDVGASVVRSLVAGGFSVVGTDMSPLTPVFDILTEFEILPPAGAPEYWTQLETLCEKHAPVAVLPVSEKEILFAKGKKSVGAGSGVPLAVLPPVLLDIFLSKLNTANFFQELGFNAPRTMPLALYEGEWGLPVVVKGDSGCGSKSYRVARDETDLAYLKAKDDGGLIAQEHVGTAEEEYTTGVFSDGERVYSVTLKRKLHPGGFSHVVELVDSPFLHEMAVMIAKRTPFLGCLNIQSRRVGSVFYPFEVNPRVSSTVMFRKKIGFDDAVWWVDALCGKKIHYVQKYVEAVGVRTFGEAYPCLKPL